MIRVGIIIRASNKWIAGLNYFRNLLYAVSNIEDKNFQPVIFISSKEDPDIIKSLKPYGEIVKTSILDTKTFVGLLNAVLIRLFNKSSLLVYLFKKNNIDVVSHSSFVSANKTLKTINWIVDFQHVHFPEMFSWFERKYRNILFLRLAKKSSAVVLSSNDALGDYKKSYPKYMNKAKVLRFVSRPNEEIYKINDVIRLKKKYGFNGKFFFLPNQLWRHKNHMVVVKALNLLKKEKKDILVICTGYMSDYRNNGYAGLVSKYIKDNNLESNIKFLGLVEYKDVLALMRHCVAIINPSLFEGWSTTVEEAKSIGKNMILSSLGVHKEQNPPSSIFFDPNDEKDLAKKLWKKWRESNGGPDYKLETIARKNIERRIINFGETYESIITGLK